MKGCGLQGAAIVCWNLSQTVLASDLDLFDAIMALADLGNSFDVIRAMRIAPMTKDAILRRAVAVLLPGLAAGSDDDVLGRLAGEKVSDYDPARTRHRHTVHYLAITRERYVDSNLRPLQHRPVSHRADFGLFVGRRVRMEPQQLHV